MFHPIVTGSIRVRRRANHARHTLLRGPTAREHSLVATVAVPVAEFFPSDPRIFVAVIVPIVIFFCELTEQEGLPSWPSPRMLRVVEFGIWPNLWYPLLCLCDNVCQLLVRLSEKNTLP